VRPADAVAKAHPVALEKIRRNEGRSQAAQPKEDVDEVQCGGTVRFPHVTGEGVGAGHDNAAAATEEKEQKIMLR